MKINPRIIRRKKQEFQAEKNFGSEENKSKTKKFHKFMN